jgi:predicted chitinase
MIKFDISEVLKLYSESGGSTDFPDSLKSVLQYVQSDKHITNVNEVAYLLATAKIESDYSLQRWEADYLCGNVGEAYIGKPCQRALDYYRSTSGGKANYYNLGVDNRGLPYFGRGLIQLTGKDNYKKYGDLIGVNLVRNGDLALTPKNSYKIASEYLNNRTYKYVNKNDLTNARKSVNGGTKKLNEVNGAYKFWLKILENPKAKFQSSKLSLKQRKGIGVSVIVLSVLAISLSLYFVLKNKNK